MAASSTWRSVSPDNGCVVGTGPYVATEVVTDDHVNLIKNVNYWDGEVKVDEITVRTISDGDTLAMALQSGEIDAAYGMAYASYPLFENDNYKFTSIQTSRCFWGMMNLNKENSGYTIMSDPAVRKGDRHGHQQAGLRQRAAQRLQLHRDRCLPRQLRVRSGHSDRVL